MSQDQIIKYIQDGHLFGFVECDIKVQDHLKEYFLEMTPIFKNVDICLNDVGEFMQNYAKQQNLKDASHCLLSGSYFGKKIGLSTPLLKWYLEHGLVITNIYIVVEYVPNPAFNTFMTQVAQVGLDGDHDKDKALIAETMKLIGNSSYGKLITNKEKHHDIVYIDETEIEAEIMDNHFYDMTELPNSYYEVGKRNRKLNSTFLFSLVSSFSTMLNFECLSSTMTLLDYCLPREDFEMVEMDTDSNYLGISAKNVKDLINPKLHEEFE